MTLPSGISMPVSLCPYEKAVDTGTRPVPTMTTVQLASVTVTVKPLDLDRLLIKSKIGTTRDILGKIERQK
jgi:hypothetical protein